MIIRKCKIDCFQKSCILLCVTFFSCSQYNCVVPGDGETGEGERTSLCIGGVSTGRLEVLTHSAAELTTVTDAIGVFQKKDIANGYETIHNRKYTYGIPYWKTDGEELVLIDGPTKLTAYYPYKEDRTSSVVMNNELYAASKEIYHCPFEASNITGAVTLNLRRAYSLLRFNFIRGVTDVALNKGEYTGNGEISSFTFSAALRVIGTLDLFIGIVKGGVQGMMFSYTVPITIGTAAVPAVSDYIVMPADFTGDLSFTLIIDGKEMKDKVSTAELRGTDKKMVEGTKYEIDVIIRPTGVEIGAVDAGEWVDKAVKDSGNPFVPQQRDRKE